MLTAQSCDTATPGESLLEREAVLAQLGELLGRDRSRVRLLLVTGESGVGKSAVLRAFAQRRAARVRLIVGHCDPAMRSRPLAPLYDIAWQFGADPGPAPERPAEQAAAFGGLLDTLIAAGEPDRRLPLVLIENVHWADEATLDWLGFLARRMDRMPTPPVALTYCEESVPRDHGLHAALADAPSDRVGRIAVPPLSAPVVERLAEAAGRDGREALALTGGNPLLLTEFLAGPRADIPPRLRHLMRARLARLDPAARDAVLLAATEPAGLEPRLLEAVGADRAGLERCRAAGVLSERGGRIAVRHEILRRALRADISAFEKHELHRRVLRALLGADAGRAAPPGRLVRHALRCDDGDVVLRHAPVAAHAAEDAREYEKAAAYYKAALRYADGSPAAERAALWEALARQTHAAGAHSAALDAQRTAVELWELAGDQSRLGEALLCLSGMLRRDAEHEEARRAVDRAIAALESAETQTALALAYAQRCRLDSADLDAAGALAWARKATRTAMRLGDARSVAAALTASGTARLPFDEKGGRAELDSACTMDRDGDGAEHRVRALIALAAHDISGHDNVRGQERVEQGLRLVPSCDIEGRGAVLTALRARARFGRGDWEDAARDAEAVLADPRAPREAIVSVLAVIGLLRSRRGDPGAEDALAQAREHGRHADARTRAAVVLALAEHAWLNNAANSAQADLELVFGRAHRARDPWLAGALAWWLHRFGAQPTVRPWYAEPYRLLLGGDWRAAAAWWERAGCPYEQAGALACACDERELLRALGLLDGLGARGAAAPVRRRMRTLGAVRVPRGPRPDTAHNPAGLTSRQLEVLRLLGDGLTDAAIAARLNLSVRTAEHHVAAILTKLAVGSRRQAAQAGRQLGITSRPASRPI